jgi:hypothetical protein
MPTSQPTSTPTSKPTSNPTSKPTKFIKEDLLQFEMKVVMSGFPTNTLDDQTQYVLILAVATVAKISTDDVSLTYTATAENLSQFIRKLREENKEQERRLATTYAIDIMYTITTRVSAYQDTTTSGQSLYQIISSNVQESVSSGTFQQILVSSCSSNCTVDFSTTTIKEVVIYDPFGTTASSSENGIDTTIFAAFAALLLPFMVYILWKFRLLNFGVVTNYFSAKNTNKGDIYETKVEGTTANIKIFYADYDEQDNSTTIDTPVDSVEVNSLVVDSVEHGNASEESTNKNLPGGDNDPSRASMSSYLTTFQSRRNSVNNQTNLPGGDTDPSRASTSSYLTTFQSRRNSV